MFWNDFSKWGSQVAIKAQISTGIFQSVSYVELDALCQSFTNKYNLGARKCLVLINAADALECIVAMYSCLRSGLTVILADSESSDLQEQLNRQYMPEFWFKESDSGWVLEKTNHLTDGMIEPELAMLLSTSGSTGSAKCVRLSYSNLNSNALSISQYLQIRTTDRTALTLPVHYSYGLSIVNSHLASGACVYIGKISVADVEFSQFLIDQEITSFAGVPYTYEILERKQFRSKTFPSLRYITQAGGRLGKENVEQFSKWAMQNETQFFVMYGQTEATARIAYLPPDLVLKYPGCIGIAIPDGDLIIRDIDGNKIEEPDQPGELIYTGPNVMLGYATDRDDLSKGREITELQTGDVACFNEDGIFYIVGRLKRFAKIYGKRYNLDEIEGYISSCGYKGICVSDDNKLYIASEQSDISNVKYIVEKKFGIKMRLVFTHVFPAMPLLSSGKFDYQAILANLSVLSEASDHKLDEEQDLKRSFSQILGIADLDESESFISLGGDSLNFLQAAKAVEEYHGRSIQGWETISIRELMKKDALSIGEGRRDVLVIARSIAVWLMMISHVFNELLLWKDLPDGIHALTKAAAPCFLIVFGVGLERSWSGKISYANYKDTVKIIIPKILMLYMSIVLVQLCFIAKIPDLDYFFLVITLNQHGRFVQILMLYMLFMMAIPVLIPFFDRLKFVSLMVLFLTPYVLHYYISPEDTGYFILDMIIGTSSFKDPSLFLTLPLILFGFLLSKWSNHDFLQKWIISVSVMASVYIIWSFVVYSNSNSSSLSGFILSFEKTDVAYYAYGIVSFLFIFLVSLFLSGRSLNSLVWNAVFSAGYAPLQLYVIGNMFLNLGPGRYVASFPVAVKLIVSINFVLALAYLGTKISRWRLPSWEQMQILKRFSKATVDLNVNTKSQRA